MVLSCVISNTPCLKITIKENQINAKVDFYTYEWEADLKPHSLGNT